MNIRVAEKLRRAKDVSPHEQITELVALAARGQFPKARKIVADLSVHAQCEAVSALAHRALNAEPAQQASWLRFMVETAKPIPSLQRQKLCDGIGITAVERGSWGLWKSVMKIYPRTRQASDIFEALASRGLDLSSTILRGMDVEQSSHNRWVVEKHLKSKSEETLRQFGSAMAQRAEELSDLGKDPYAAAALPWAQEAFDQLRAKGAYPPSSLIQQWIEHEQLQLVADYIRRTKLEMYSVGERLEITLALAHRTESMLRWKREEKAAQLWRRTWWPLLHPLLPMVITDPSQLPLMTSEWRQDRDRPGLMYAMTAKTGNLVGRVTNQGVAVDVPYQCAAALAGSDNRRDPIARDLYTDVQQWHLERAVKTPPLSSTPRRRM